MERGKREGNKTQPNPTQTPRIAYAEGRSQAAGAAPTLRYGPAGDSAPRLRLKASGMTERFPFGPSTRPEYSAFWAWCDAIERYQMRYKITG